MIEMILIRGLPGSGKSTLAKEFESLGFVHVEADQYFMNTIGNYIFDPTKLKDAHEWCQKEVKDVLRHGRDPVVSNTFSMLWEMKPYIDLASQFGVKFRVITCEGDYGNIHNVPNEVITKMKERWERY